MTKRLIEIPLPGGGVVFTDGEPINESDEPCRYACSAFPNCGCEVEALSPAPGICTCGKPVEPGFLLCLPCWHEFHKDEQPAGKTSK